MGNKLRTLFNTLFDVETKGDSTILMGNCLTFIKQCMGKIYQDLLLKIYVKSIQLQ